MATAAASLTEAIRETQVSGNFNRRYEDVDNSSVSSDLLSLRSRLTFKSGAYRHFSAVVGIEDIHAVFGVDDSCGLVNDRDVTELGQAYIEHQTNTIKAS
jgi:hypothetical protein